MREAGHGTNTLSLEQTATLWHETRVPSGACLASQLPVLPGVLLGRFQKHGHRDVSTHNNPTQLFELGEQHLWERMAGQEADVLAFNSSGKEKYKKEK